MARGRIVEWIVVQIIIGYLFLRGEIISKKPIDKFLFILIFQSLFIFHTNIAKKFSAAVQKERGPRKIKSLKRQCRIVPPISKFAKCIFYVHEFFL